MNRSNKYKALLCNFASQGALFYETDSNIHVMLHNSKLCFNCDSIDLGYIREKFVMDYNIQHGIKVWYVVL